jgi:L-ascorbate metabolism protein UlaG (beta-lactamase superfamily)
MAKSIRFLGQSGFIISSPGDKNIVIDPWITDNPVCPIKTEEIESANMVLVTHDHFDHTANAAEISTRTGAVLVAQPEVLNVFRTNYGLADANMVFGGYGMNIGGSFVHDGITVTMTQAFHSSGSGTPCGYLIKLEDGSIIYHAGDTGIFDSMRLIGELYPLDLALLPTGGVFTMDSFQAAKAVALLKPRRVIPMHYQTMPILEQSAENFVALVKKEAPQVEVAVLQPGEEYSIT